MNNSLRYSITLLVAVVLCHGVSLSQPTGSAGRPSPANLVEQWSVLPAQERAARLEKLIAQCKARALTESDVEQGNRSAALLNSARAVEADPLNGELIAQFFSLYADFKAAKPGAPVVQEQPPPEARAMTIEGVAATAVVISPKDLPFWTGTIHESWWDGYKKSDFEIWAGDNIVGTGFRGWVVFDISALPANAVVKSITLTAYTWVASNSYYHQLYVCAPLNNCDPRTTYGKDLYDRMRTSTVFNSVTTSMQSTGPKTIPLNAYANSQLQQRIGQYDWWALGIFEQGDDDDWGVFCGHDSPLRPKCEVVYEVPLPATSVDEIGASVPTTFNLQQNYPNPFNPGTTIRYELPKSSDVRLSVCDLLGREVSVLVNERASAGVHEVKFDGSNLASGVYLYRLQAGSLVQTKKLILLH